MEFKEVPVIEEFLKQWRKKAEHYYIQLRINYRKAMNIKQYEEQARAEGLERSWEITNRACHLQYEAKKNFISILNSTTANLLHDYSQFEDAYCERLGTILDREVKGKRFTLYTRVEKKAGNIVDASGLRLGSNGEINGFITGDKTKVEVQTIFAGGYNIQVLHYRVLVKECK